MNTVNETLTAATLLQHCGRILYFRKNPVLKDYVILEPAWLASFIVPLFVQEVLYPDLMN